MSDEAVNGSDRVIRIAGRPVLPITSMRLQNLRRFEDTEWLEFSRINFVFGKNSSGKTTLLRVPLLLKQFVGERSLIGGVPFSGPYVDFGSYPEAVHNLEVKRDITLAFEVDSETLLGNRSRPLTRRLPFLADTITTELKMHWNAKRGQAQFNAIIMYNDRTDSPLVRFSRLGPERIRIDAPWLGANTIVTDASELNLGVIRALTLESDALDPVLDLLGIALTSGLNRVASRLIHVGPLRDMPERAYRLDQLSSSGGPTEHVVAMLAAQPDAQSTVSRSLRRLGIAKRVDLVRPAPGYAGIVLSDTDSSRKDNLADVGFGASQVLPILVRLALAPPRSMLLVEQPELHLHPEVQGELADVIIDMAYQRRCSVLVESHSENMLLRVRRKIAEGSLEASDVKIFVTDGGHVREAVIDEKGRIDMTAFPSGFFEEEWFEAMGIIQGGAQRA